MSYAGYCGIELDLKPHYKIMRHAKGENIQYVVEEQPLLYQSKICLDFFEA